MQKFKHISSVTMLDQNSVGFVVDEDKAVFLTRDELLVWMALTLLDMKIEEEGE